MPKLILCTFMLELGLDLHSPLAGPLFTIDDDDFDHTRSFQHARALQTRWPADQDSDDLGRACFCHLRQCASDLSA
jgi:hypothetical protein